MVKVVHMTSVHPPFDTRIFHKECKTLAAAGYEVVLIAPHDKDEVVDGVAIRAVPKFARRIQRMFRTAWNVYRVAKKEAAFIYHFHDPELIPYGWLLKAHGKTVVYDIHEDYNTAIRQKSYLPRILRTLLANLFALFEGLTAHAFTLITAERYYSRHFPNGFPILNYPQVDFQDISTCPPQNPTYPKLIYTGVVSLDRGALNHARLLSLRDDIEVHIIGRCPLSLYEQMQAIASPHQSRLHFTGVGCHVPYEQITNSYTSGDWLAGLALFPSSPHYREKELTKFFEYMSFGIPIICSDFPVWRELVVGQGVGLCVPPDDTTAIADAISWLLEHPAEAQAMGQRGRQAVIEQYNWDSQARKLLALYDTLLSRSE